MIVRSRIFHSLWDPQVCQFNQENIVFYLFCSFSSKNWKLCTCLKLFNALLRYFHIESNFVSFQKEIYKFILECETYCRGEFIRHCKCVEIWLYFFLSFDSFQLFWFCWFCTISINFEMKLKVLIFFLLVFENYYTIKFWKSTSAFHLLIIKSV